MALRTILFLAILPLLVSFAEPAIGGESTRYYLLAEPIRNQVKAPVAIPIAWVGYNIASTGAQVAGVYAGTGDLVATTSFASAKLLIDLPQTAAGIRGSTIAFAAWKNRDQLKKIAGTKGAVKIHTIDSGLVEGGLFRPQVARTSYVIIEVTGETAPEEIEPHQPLVPNQGIARTKKATLRWEPLEDLDTSYLRLELELPGYPGKLEKIELGLKDILDGAELDEKTLSVWKRAIADWKKSGVWKSEIKREILRDSLEKSDYEGQRMIQAEMRSDVGTLDTLLARHFEGIKIKGAIVRNGEAMPIGILAEGRAAASLLGMNWKSVAFQSVLRMVGREPKRASIERQLV